MSRELIREAWRNRQKKYSLVEYLDTVSSLTGFPPRVLLFGSQHAKDTVHVKTLSEFEIKNHPKVVSRYILSHCCPGGKSREIKY